MSGWLSFLDGVSYIITYLTEDVLQVLFHSSNAVDKCDSGDIWHSNNKSDIGGRGNFLSGGGGDFSYWSHRDSPSQPKASLAWQGKHTGLFYDQ